MPPLRYCIFHARLAANIAVSRGSSAVGTAFAMDVHTARPVTFGDPRLAPLLSDPNSPIFGAFPCDIAAVVDSIGAPVIDQDALAVGSQGNRFVD